jgi:uncharacterized membrane protein YhaH (DUF805 family)
VFVYGWIWSGLKRLLVREGRASRQDFALKGLLPLWLALFGLLTAPAFPWVGELGVVLIIAAVFFSRAALAIAIRRARDLGLPADHFTSFQRQTVAYVQAFMVLVFATTYQTASAGNPFGSIVVAGMGATAITMILLGGPKLVMLLLRTPAATTAEDVIGALKAAAEAPAPGPKPMPSHPLQAKVRPAAPAQPVPEGAPRARPVYKTKAAPQAAREPGFPQPHSKPIVRKRKRGAIGEWN